jgi:hypothetical protein
LFNELADLSPQARTQYLDEREVDEDIRREVKAPNKSDLVDAGKWIVRLYQAWDQPDRAAEWQAKLESDGADAIGVVRK